MKRVILTAIGLTFGVSNSIAGDLESDLQKALNERYNRSYYYNNSDTDNLLPQIGTVGSTTITTQEEKVFGKYFFKKARQHLNIIDDPVLDEYIGSSPMPTTFIFLSIFFWLTIRNLTPRHFWGEMSK